MLDKNKVKLGIAPIGWCNDDMPELGAENTFQQIVSEMALAGYKGSEVGNKYPKDKVELKKALDLRGLEICNQWFTQLLLAEPFEVTERALKDYIDYTKYCGSKIVGASEQSYSIQGLPQPILEGKYVMNDEEWDRMLSGMNKLGAIAKEHGMKYCFHHHMGTVVQTEEEIDRMMDGLGENCYLLFDSGHCSFADIDPVKVMSKYIDRIGHIHLKDLRKDVVAESRKNKWSFLESVRNGCFTVPGDGDVDFKPLFDIIEQSGYEGYIVVEAEQDPAKANPLEYAIKGRKYIAEMTGL